MVRVMDENEVILDAIKWASAEYKYFKDLQKDLDRLKTKIELAAARDSVPKLRALFKDLKYIGRAEARFNDYEKHVEGFLSKASKRDFELAPDERYYPSYSKILLRLHTEAAEIIRVASLYEGRIKDNLNELAGKIKKNDLAGARTILSEIEGSIKETEQWLAAISGDLATAKKIAKKLKNPQEADTALENFYNPKNLAEIKKILKEEGCGGIKLFRTKGGFGISGKYTNKQFKLSSEFDIVYLPKRKEMVIEYTNDHFWKGSLLRTGKAHPMAGEKHPLLYSLTGRKKKYPTFRSFLLAFLKILRGAVDETDTSSNQIWARFKRAGLV